MDSDLNIFVPENREYLLRRSTIFDNDLENALVQYQEFFHLPTTGELDNDTRKMMARPRCGVPEYTASKAKETKFAYYPGKPKWNKLDLTYALENFPFGIERETIKSSIKAAFDVWKSAVPTFNFSLSDRISSSNIKLRFADRQHSFSNQGACWSFDGREGVIAHAFPPELGIVHFDRDEKWSVNANPRFDQKDLITCSIHEIGHVLGLEHSTVSEDVVMYPIHKNNRRALQPDDIQAIQGLYVP
jgi:hypothetical protein